MSLFKSILRFKEIEKDCERFLVQSKKKTIVDVVNIALANLKFHAMHATSEYICNKGSRFLKTVVLRGAVSVGVLQDNLVLSTELIKPSYLTFVKCVMVSSRREIICSRTWKNYRHLWEPESWPCFPAEKFG